MTNRCTRSSVQPIAELLLIVIVFSTAVGIASPLHAAAIGPYQLDQHTLHLYHFDETSGLAADSVSSSPVDLTVTGPTQGVAGSSGTGYDFNRALDFGTTASQYIAERSSGLTVNMFQGSNGAFTYEALVKLGTTNPGDFGVYGREILSMDWYHTQFRIDSRDNRLRLVFFTDGGTTGGASIGEYLPTSGNDAVSVDTWFHVAVAYDGGNTANLYWTRLRDDATAASLLATSTSFADSPAFTGQGNFSVGNYREQFTISLPPGVLSSWPGMIDEVRISSVARSESDFIFAAVPEPAMACHALGLSVAVLAHALLYAWRIGPERIRNSIEN